MKEPRYFNPLSNGSNRNRPCVCGSGKKIKKCHGVESSVSKDEYDRIIRMIHQFNVRYKTAFAENAKKALEELDARQQQQETKDNDTGVDRASEEVS